MKWLASDENAGCMWKSPVPINVQTPDRQLKLTAIPARNFFFFLFAS
jgi:hypothetical protein